MTINLSVPSNNDTLDLKPRITVLGVGGGGGNAWCSSPPAWAAVPERAPLR